MAMTEHQKDQILKVVEYYMEPELRERIMREAPIAYNAWMGRVVVEVVIRPVKITTVREEDPPTLITS